MESESSVDTDSTYTIPSPDKRVRNRRKRVRLTRVQTILPEQVNEPETVGQRGSEPSCSNGQSHNGRDNGGLSGGENPRTTNRSREWLATVPEASFPNRAALEEAITGCSGAIYQLEEGQGGFRHYQLWVRFKNQCALSTIAKKLNNSHCEKVKSSAAAKRYCSKEESRVDGPWYIGDHAERQPGQRTDLHQLEEAVKRGDDDKQLWEGNFGTMVKYHKSIGRARAALQIDSKRRQSCTIYVLWGPTGTGKSARCAEMAPNAYRLAAPPTDNQGLWWDGYCGQRDVIIDEFNSWIKITTLLTYLDIYPALLQIKGDTVPLVAERWFICSNTPPDEWYRNSTDAQREALMQRFTNGRGPGGRGSIVHVTSLDQTIDGFNKLSFI